MYIYIHVVRVKPFLVIFGDKIRCCEKSAICKLFSSQDLMSCDAWKQDLMSCNAVGVSCYENKTICHMCTIVYCILFSIVFDIFVVDVHTFYLQSIYFLSSNY